MSGRQCADMAEHVSAGSPGAARLHHVAVQVKVALVVAGGPAASDDISGTVWDMDRAANVGPGAVRQLHGRPLARDGPVRG